MHDDPNTPVNPYESPKHVGSEPENAPPVKEARRPMTRTAVVGLIFLMGGAFLRDVVLVGAGLLLFLLGAISVVVHYVRAFSANRRGDNAD